MFHCMLVVFHWGVIAAAVITGFVAAYLWFKSSKVSHDPFYGGVESGDALTAQSQWLTAMQRDYIEVARLNRLAAIYTAWSVGLSAVTTILGVFA